MVANTDLNASMFASSGIVASVTPNLDKGMRAMSVQVDQVTGVGTLIQTGDHVDVIIGFGGSTAGSTCGTGFQLDNVDPKTGVITPVSALGGSSIKMVVQSSKVVGTLLPPPPPLAANGRPASTAPSGTSLNGQQEIVLLEVTAQQAEVIRYGQVDGCLSLVLRSPKDYVDASTPPNPVVPPLDPTTGVILKTLVDQYGVLPPQIIQVVLAQEVDSPRAWGSTRPSGSSQPRGRTGATDPHGSRARRSLRDVTDPHEGRRSDPNGRQDPRPHRRRHHRDPRSPGEAAWLRK